MNLPLEGKKEAEEAKDIRERASRLAAEYFTEGRTTREDVLLLVEHALEPVLKKDAPRVTETFERGSGI